MRRGLAASRALAAMALLQLLILGAVAPQPAIAQNCRSIDDNCDECTGSMCDKCEQTFFLLGNSCVESCEQPGEQKYFNVDGERCERCHSSCDSCIGPTSSDCIKCKPESGYLYNGACVAQCPITTYAVGTVDDANGRRCESCTDGCGRCNTTVCLACSPGFYRQGTVCVRAQQCADGSGAVEGDNPDLGGECVPCFDTTHCLTCSGPGEADCTVCDADTFLQNGTCVVGCDTSHALGPAAARPTSPNAATTTAAPATTATAPAPALECLPCSSFESGCALCESDASIKANTTSAAQAAAAVASANVTCKRCEDGFFLNTTTATCLEATTCNAFQKATIKATPTRDAVCVSCVLCGAGTYDANGCQTVKSQTACTPCTSTCAQEGQLPTGLCTPTTTPMCEAPTVGALPIQDHAFVDTTFTLTGLPNATRLAASVEGDLTRALFAASSVFSLDAFTLGTTAPATSEAPVTTAAGADGDAGTQAATGGGAAQSATVQTQRLVSAFAPAVISPSSLDVRVRASVPTADAEMAGNELWSYQSPTPFSALVTEMPADYSSMFLSATTPTVTSVDVLPRNVRVTNSTSKSITVDWTDVPAAPPARVPVTYVVHLVRESTAKRLSFETSESSVTLSTESLSLDAGTYRIAVGTVLESGQAARVGPMVAASTAVPECEEDCLECTQTSCLSCNASQGLTPQGMGCASISSASGSFCLSLGDGMTLCDTALVFAAIGAAIGVLLVLTLLYCLCTRGRVQHKRDVMEWNEYELHDVKFLPRWTTADADTRAGLSQSRPLSLPELESSLAGQMDIAGEYGSIPLNAANMDEVPSAAMAKNRFVTILPNQHSRVPLSAKPSSDDGADFINANFVRDVQEDTPAYILTQAPLNETVEDFYHMLWDRKVSCVVMMCRLVEGGHVVCPRYVPTRSPTWSKVAAPTSEGLLSTRARVLRFGRFRVRLLKETITDVFTITRLRVSNRAVGSRTITHIAYHAWPDASKISVTANDLISFVRLVRTVHKQHASPLVVHCTSGADRAACVVATDMLMRQCDHTGEADVLGVVCRIRQDRGSTFSSPSLYGLLYDVALTYLRTTATTSPHLHSANPKFDEPSVMESALRRPSSLTGSLDDLSEPGTVTTVDAAPAYRFSSSALSSDGEEDGDIGPRAMKAKRRKRRQQQQQQQQQQRGAHRRSSRRSNTSLGSKGSKGSRGSKRSRHSSGGFHGQTKGFHEEGGGDGDDAAIRSAVIANIRAEAERERAAFLREQLEVVQMQREAAERASFVGLDAYGHGAEDEEDTLSVVTTGMHGYASDSGSEGSSDEDSDDEAHVVMPVYEAAPKAVPTWGQRTHYSDDEDGDDDNATADVYGGDSSEAGGANVETEYQTRILSAIMRQ